MSDRGTGSRPPKLSQSTKLTSSFASQGGYGGRRPPKLSLGQGNKEFDESGFDWEEDDGFDDDSDAEEDLTVCQQCWKGFCLCVRSPINPDSDSKVNWDVLIMVLVVYVAFMVPYQIGFATVEAL